MDLTSIPTEVEYVAIDADTGCMVYEIAGRMLDIVEFYAFSATVNGKLTDGYCRVRPGDRIIFWPVDPAGAARTLPIMVIRDAELMRMVCNRANARNREVDDPGYGVVFGIFLVAVIFGLLVAISQLPVLLGF